jgi:carboxylesterase type B
VNGCEWEQTLIQHSLPFGEYSQSDTECLTLNIAAPTVKASGGLPVLVFVHGGAFATGSTSYPQNDLARITELSAEINKPMIAVGVK